MERSTASLTYKGSISEAIVEAQNQKKLFLVYISGEDEYSTNLESSTWVNERVVEAVSRYCIFLHLIQGHIEALQFSSIYPQKSVPSISAVGFNGVMLWQHEGYIKAENFVECIEKSWAAMHFQDTAAALLTAALASEKREPTSVVNPDVGQSEQEGYPNQHEASPSADHSNDAEAGFSSDPEAMVEDICNDDTTAIQLDNANALSREDTETLDSGTTEILHSVTKSMQILKTTSNEHLPKENCSNSSPKQGSQINANEVHEGIESVSSVTMEGKSTNKSTDVYLGIRMPSEISLQSKFTITDTLSSVKTYVDHSQGSSQCSYDLAIPYPRTVFTEEDMSKSLEELGITGRQALIAIPRQVQGHPRSSSSSTDIHAPSNQTNSSVGYYEYLKRVFSYMNPFSYFTPIHDDSSSSRTDTGNSARRTSSPFGSNVHTLRHGEGDFPTGDRNTFWNGNSTQYGGDEK